MKTTIYIAETDDTNAISSVWIKPSGKKTAKVFNPKKHRYDPSESAEFTGASEAEIVRWLVARAAKAKQ